MINGSDNQFIQIPLNLYEQIMFRDLEYVATKMLLYAFRFTFGCNGAERKISNDEFAIRSYFVTLQKKDFQVLGFPKQTITKKLQWFVKMNIFIEAQTTLALNHKPTNVYCYSLNLDFSSWKDETADKGNQPEKSDEKIDVKKIYNKTVHTNISLASMQVNKVKNALRCQKILNELKEKSPIEQIMSLFSNIFNQKMPLSNFLITTINTSGKKDFLIGTENVLKDSLIKYLIKDYSERSLMLATLTLDLQLIFGTASLGNEDVENALIELIGNPEQALVDLFEHWINNIVQTDNTQQFSDGFQDSLNELLALDGSLSQGSNFISRNDEPMCLDDTENESEQDSEQEDENYYID